MGYNRPILGQFWASCSFILKNGIQICWIFRIPQALINILRIWSSKICFDFMNKLKFSLSMYIFEVKLILLPQISSKSKYIFFEMFFFARSTILLNQFFQFYLCSPENFCNKFTLILKFFSSFFGQISCKIFKNGSLFKKSTLFSKTAYCSQTKQSVRLIHFFFLRFKSREDVSSKKI